jgi:nicotinamide riboside kinase
MMRKVILISGGQGAGKTTLANHLMTQFALYPKTKVEHFAFADPIYKMHDYCLNVMKELGFDRETKKDGRLLQLLGTEWGRAEIDSNVWVKIAATRIERMLYNSWAERNIFIISDCRFKNELEFFKDALKIRLVASEEVRKQRCNSWRATTNHASEIDLLEYEKEGKFDLMFDTENKSAASIAAEVVARVLSELKAEGKFTDI